MRSLHKNLFQLAHDSLSHFRFDKSYGSLHSAYYWPNMCHDLEKGYVTSCPECQHNKSSISKPNSPLHPLPIPDQCGDSVAMDFIGPLSEDDSNNCIVTFTDCLGNDIQLAATQTDISTKQLAYIVFVLNSGRRFTNWQASNSNCQLPITHKLTVQVNKQTKPWINVCNSMSNGTNWVGHAHSLGFIFTS